MADVLACLLSDKITVERLIYWLETGKSDVYLEALDCPRSEVVPYFLNWLRDQTLHLVQDSKLATPSPAKVLPSPATLKVLSSRSSDGPKEKHSSEGGKRTPRYSRGKRTQLFPENGKQRCSPTSPDFTAVHDLNKSSPSTPRNRSFDGDPNIDPLVNEISCHGKNHRKFLTPDSLQKKHSPHNSVGNQDKRLKTPSPNIRHRFGGSDGGFIERNSNHTLASHITKGTCSDLQGDSPSLDSDNFPALSSVMFSREASTSNKLKVNPRSKCQNLDGTAPDGENNNSTPQMKKTRPKHQAPVKQPSRRITPTPVGAASLFQSAWKNTPTVKVSSATSWMFANSPVESHSNVEDERKILRDMRAKQKCEPVTNCEDRNLVTPEKAARTSVLDHSSSVDILKANPEQVTFGASLDKLASLHSWLLSECLVPNLMVEFYFLMRLLTCGGAEFTVDDSLNDSYFETFHNAVHFSVRVLETQLSFLSCLDKTTLRLLRDNQRVLDFSPELQNNLSHIIDKATISERERGSGLPVSAVGGVSFQAETDNRGNFSSDKTFYLFKKQRDLFYECVRMWQENHEVPGWSVAAHLKSYIAALTNTAYDLVNQMHFIRLFTNQLVQMSKEDNLDKNLHIGADSDTGFLADLKKSNPEKFSRLVGRLLHPSWVGSPAPGVSWPGCQQFFREFILTASCHTFNQHLADELTARILQETHDKISDTVSTLRVVGKFLGLVTFLPYQTPEPLPEPLRLACVKAREQMNERIEILELVQNSKLHGRLIVVIPWVVEYMSQMDAVAPFMQHYRTLYRCLATLYRQLAKHLSGSRADRSTVLLLLLIGWLFEISVFPEGSFFIEYDASLDLETSAFPASGLDLAYLVDSKLLYTCCPYLGEIKNMLVDFSTGCTGRGTNVRKITPLSTEPLCNKEPPLKVMQRQLEENFFHNQPSSLRRCVEFVSERLSSNFISKVKTEFVSDLMSQGRVEVTKLDDGIMAISPARCKDRAYHQIHTVAMALIDNTRQKVLQSMSKYCREQSAPLMRQLLGDASDSVVKTCSEICTRHATQQLCSWLTTHITGAILKKEMIAEYDQLHKDVDLTSPKGKGEAKTDRTSFSHAVEDIVHEEKSPTPSEVLLFLRELLHLLMINEEICKEQVVEALDKTWNVIIKRKDIMLAVLRMLGTVTVELAFSLILQQKVDLDEQIQSRLFNLWCGPLKNCINFTDALCAKYICWPSEEPSLQMKNFGFFLAEVVTRECVEARCLLDCADNLSTSLSQDGCLKLAKCLPELVRALSDVEDLESLQIVLDRCTYKGNIDKLPIQTLSACYLTELVNIKEESAEEEPKLESEKLGCTHLRHHVHNEGYQQEICESREATVSNLDMILAT